MKDQIERIKIKLFLAKDIDKDFEVFGAESHEYVVGKTISNDVILEFEKKYTICLPECYKAFLLHIGNGGISYQNSAAGPGYGVFPLGKNVEEFVHSNPEKILKQDCKVYPKMDNDFWKELNEKIDEDISDEDFEYELGKIFSGILPIGTEGCTYYSGLVLNGEFKGRVVNVDIDRRKPYFAFESNFLDWYERWLDEITAETENNDNDLFNYTLGGAVSHIFDIYFAADDEETKQECLIGILKKKNLNSSTLDILEEQYKISSGEIQKKLLQLLTKFDYERAKSYLIDFSNENLLVVFQFVFWYAKDKSCDWFEVIKENIIKIKDEETFRFCTYLLKEMNLDYGAVLVPCAFNENKEIRVEAYYSLGQLKNKSDYLDTFMKGLSDNSNRVVHTVLQALDGLDELRLLVHYKQISEKFPVEEDYILTNLNNRLKPFDLDNITIKKINFTVDGVVLPEKKKSYQFWK